MTVEGIYIPKDPEALAALVAKGEDLHFHLHCKQMENGQYHFTIYVGEEPQNRVFLAGSMRGLSRGGV